MLRDKLKLRLNLKTNFKKNILLIKITVSYIIVGTMLLSLLSFFLYKSFESISLKQIENSNEKVLYQDYKMTEAYWVSTFGYMYQEYIGDEILSAGLDSQSLTSLDYGNISKQLGNIVSSNNFIKSIYLYNGEAKLVFSDSNTVQDINYFYDKDFLNDLYKYDTTKMPFLVPRKVTSNVNGDKQDSNVISMIFMQKKNSGNVSALIYNLDEQVLQKVVTSENEDKSNTIFIIDRNGVIISHPDVKKVNTNIKDSQYIKTILTADNNVGNFINEDEGKRVLINYKKWDNLGWTFVSVSDYKSLLKKASSLQKDAVLIMCIFIFISILISLMFTRNIYIPINRLLTKIRLSNKNGEIQSESELEYLWNTYDYLLQNTEKSSSSLIDIATIKKIALNQLLHSDYNGLDEIKETLQNVQLQFNNKYFIIVVFRIDEFCKLSEKYDKKDVNLYRYGISNICGEIFAGIFDILEVSETGEDNVSVLINYNEVEVDFSKIYKYIAAIQNISQQYLSISLTAGISNIAEDVSQVGYSYNNALESTNYRIIYGSNSIINYSQLKREDYTYPLDIEMEILEALKYLDEKNINESLHRFIKHISKFTYDEMKLSLMQMILIAIKHFKDTVSTEEHIKSQLNLDYKTINDKLEMYDRMDKIEEWVEEIFNKMFYIYKSQKELKHINLVNVIKNYIEENFCNSSISIDSISELVSLSPNYVRTLFKENMDISISNYIGKLRLDKAKKMLLNTEYPANKIAEMVGYNNSSYFYTVFKKSLGKSPDDFRMDKNNNNNETM